MDRNGVVVVTEIDVDLMVIGWGKAGKTLAQRLAAEGKKVALAERSPKMYGGTCINIACVHTKDLVDAASKRRPNDDPAAYFRTSVEERDALIAKLNAANHAMLEGKATLLDGTARFTGPHSVAVTTEDGEVTVNAEHIVVGTGATPTVPPIDGVDLTGVYDSTTIQHADPFPHRLAVIGGGYIGLEYASMFQQFGAEVTVLDGGETFLPRIERVVADAAHEVLTGRGITIRQNARATAIVRASDGLRVALEDGDPVETDAVLVAVGRAPASADLGLEAAGITTDDKGFIEVDDHLRTSVEGVWAVGDVNGGPQHTYISLDDNRIVHDQLLGDGARSRADRVAVPTTTFLTPPLSQVGMSPQEAKDAGHDVLYAAKEVAKIAAAPRPKIVGEPEGVIAVTADAKTQKILGATLFCVDSQELVNMVALAIRLGAGVADLRDGIWTHPSTTEAFNEVLASLEPWEG